MKIFGFPNTRATRGVWAAEEVGADYEYVKVDLAQGGGRQMPYVGMNPGGKVPALQDGDLFLTESAAIVNYLADRFPERGLSPPGGSPERARHDQWCYFVIGELEQPLWTIAKHKFAIPRERRVEGIRETALWEFSVATNVLAQGLGDKAHILGERFSGADILIAHTLRWARAFDVPLGHARLEEYADRTLAREALDRATVRESAA